MRYTVLLQPSHNFYCIVDNSTTNHREADSCLKDLIKLDHIPICGGETNENWLASAKTYTTPVVFIHTDDYKSLPETHPELFI